MDDATLNEQDQHNMHAHHTMFLFFSLFLFSFSFCSSVFLSTCIQLSSYWIDLLPEFSCASHFSQSALWFSVSYPVQLEIGRPRFGYYYVTMPAAQDEDSLCEKM